MPSFRKSNAFICKCYTSEDHIQWIIYFFASPAHFPGSIWGVWSPAALPCALHFRTSPTLVFRLFLSTLPPFHLTRRDPLLKCPEPWERKKQRNDRDCQCGRTISDANSEGLKPGLDPVCLTSEIKSPAAACRRVGMQPKDKSGEAAPDQRGQRAGAVFN